MTPPGPESPALSLPIRGLFRYPVKSMQGEAVDHLQVHPGGVVGDRAVALLDVETGRVVSAHHPDKWGLLLHCQARWDGDPATGQIVVTLPDGQELPTGAKLETALGKLLGRRVALIRENPEGGSYEIVHPSIDGAAPQAFLDRTLELAGVRDGRVGRLGVGLDAPRGALVDVAPVHLVTTGSLATLADAGVDADARRFRPNVVLDTGADGTGYDESRLADTALQLGDVQLRTTIPTPRCIVPTTAQAGLGKDPEVLRKLAADNRLVIGNGSWACLGLYARPENSGALTLTA